MFEDTGETFQDMNSPCEKTEADDSNLEYANSGLPSERAFQLSLRTNRPNEEHGRIRILVLIPALDIGGVQMDLVRNLPRLDPRWFRFVVCTLSEIGPLAAQLIEQGIEVISPETNFIPGSQAPFKMISAWRHFQLARWIACYIDTGNFQVIHAILPSAYVIGFLSKLLCRGSRPTLIMSRVSLNWYQKGHWPLRTLERHIHSQCQFAIANCDAIRLELLQEGMTDDKIVLIHNGIDAHAIQNALVGRDQARKMLGLPSDAMVFSVVANLLAYKGHADLLHALAIAKDRLPANWVLLAAGRDRDGRLAQLTQFASELGLTQNVRFVGQRLDVATILSAADIHVSASHTEGFPNNILEAMCVGLPIVATAVGGVPEQITHQQTGYLLSPHKPSELADALALLASDREKRLAIGRAARKHVAAQFPIVKSVAALAQAYTRAGASTRIRQCRTFS